MAEAKLISQELCSVLVASTINRTLKSYTGEFNNYRASFSLNSFIEDFHKLSNIYLKRYSTDGVEAEHISKDTVIKVLGAGHFTKFVEVSNDSLIIEAIPNTYETLLKNIVATSTFIYSKQLVKSISELSARNKANEAAVAAENKDVQPSSVESADVEMKEPESATNVPTKEDEDVQDQPIEEEISKENDEIISKETDDSDKVEEKEDEIEIAEEDSAIKADEADKSEEQVEHDDSSIIKDSEAEATELGNETESSESKNDVDDEDIQLDIVDTEGDKETIEVETVEQEPTKVEVDDHKPEIEAEEEEEEEEQEEEQVVDIDDEKKQDEEAAEEIEPPVEVKESEIPAEDEVEVKEDAVEEDKEEEEEEEEKVEFVEEDQEVTKAENDVEQEDEENEVGDEAEEEEEEEEVEETKSHNFRKRSLSPAAAASAQHKRFQHIAINLITSIQAHRFSSPFLQAVNKRDAHDYYDIIHFPKDLKGILKGVKSKSDPPEYQSIKELERDIMLMFANCVMYNKSDEELVRLTIIMKNEVSDIFKMFEEAESDIK
ncbi:hypothetical protein DFJ63DRAFT_312678 [Scheffersomyces coipomensis]|uniref:uncharacterized protein n=1 Tax=Scheffersomyces coipomensis TaxID=1788519 RepID=UPI00315CDFDF